jgi:hypothetical protein
MARSTLSTKPQASDDRCGSVVMCLTNNGHHSVHIAGEPLKQLSYLCCGHKTVFIEGILCITLSISILLDVAISQGELSVIVRAGEWK